MSIHTRPYKLNQPRTRILVRNAMVSLLADSNQTGGMFNLLDMTCPSDFETQLLIHYAEDVAIIVLQGELDVFWGEEKHRAEAGSFFFQPRGTPHGFRVTGNTEAHLLYLTFPAGFDGLMLELAQETSDLKSMLIASRYKIEVLGPLPEQLEKKG